MNIYHKMLLQLISSLIRDIQKEVNFLFNRVIKIKTIIDRNEKYKVARWILYWKNEIFKKNVPLTIAIILIYLYFKVLLGMSNCIEKFTVDRERSPIPQERRVVTASWKRLGVVSGLRRTSTLPVVGTFFLRLRCVCVSRCCGPRHRMFPYRTRKASGSRRKHCQITQIPRKPVGLVRHVNHKRRLTLAAILVPFVLCDSY